MNIAKTQSGKEHLSTEYNFLSHLQNHILVGVNSFLSVNDSVKLSRERAITPCSKDQVRKEEFLQGIQKRIRGLGVSEANPFLPLLFILTIDSKS